MSRTSVSSPHPYKVLPVTFIDDDAGAVGLDALSKLPMFVVFVFICKCRRRGADSCRRGSFSASYMMIHSTGLLKYNNRHLDNKKALYNTLRRGQYPWYLPYLPGTLDTSP